ncbi:MAG: tRNA (adenosine(37)-N6)-threonylcarbamoyltransferase complex transferase subunit TsaD [Chitinispirillaceae bacterium]|nr:tRNA (adenosine(37)-N6)-threonylcarbamoyltransferase complex transferase subunit TsaD [Chitinispirillaceae bacterium]
MITLGIESSCDETSIALLDNEKILFNTIYSQMDHSRFGGVVPELASRAHLEKIDRLAQSCFEETGLTPRDIDCIAVTDGPGLAGALLVGISFALGLRSVCNCAMTGVNHLEGHICSALLMHPDIDTPFLALVVSGGHTALYRVDSFDAITCLGETVDDAAGEAFDKVGKMLGFPYPAGRLIEEEAARFTGAEKELPSFTIAKCSQGDLHFSFSGLKTAVKYLLQGKSPEETLALRPALCHAFQRTIAASLAINAKKAAERTGISTIVFVGGVACNGFLRETLKKEFPGTVIIPERNLCTDNAAMIALAGYLRHQRGRLQEPSMSPSRGL